MTLVATVLIPTHDHGPTLLRSVRSALAQTVEELEVFVVGDGVPASTREVMAELTGSDERVRFFDNPKGPRHGEIHRHEALQQARSEIVCYLSDDDLWLPGHVQELQLLLADADFAHARPLWIDAEGGPHQWLADLGNPYYAGLVLGGENRIPLSCAGHTLELYRRLPSGWRTTPAGTPTDLYMWQQILSAPNCLAVSGSRPTVLHFPSTAREGWSSDERLAELDAWARRLTEPALESELADRLGEELRALAHALDQIVHNLNRQLAETEQDRVRLTKRLARLDAQLGEVSEERAWLSRRLDTSDARLRAVDEERALLSGQLDDLAASVTWRLRARLVALPGLGALFRRAARALARPVAPEEADSPHRAPTLEPTVPAKESPARDRPSDTPARRSGPSTP